jgi:predicted nucleic acid-binding protein
LTNQQPDMRVADFIRKAGQENLFLSVMTVGEICKGIDLLPVSQQPAGLQDAVTETIAERWGHLAAAARKQGVTLAVVDGVIAATALEHDLTVVTRNVKDFTGLGVMVLNPWDAV